MLEKAKIYIEKNPIVISLIASVFLHAFGLGFLLNSDSFIKKILLNEEIQELSTNIKKKSEATILLRSKEKEENKQTEEKFLSDRNVLSQGSLTKDEGYNVHINDANEVDLNNSIRTTSLVPNKKNEEEKKKQEEKEKRDKGIESVKESENKEAISVNSPYQPANAIESQMKMPSSYKDDEFRVGFSSKGKLIFGSGWIPYAEYLTTFVEHVRKSWYEEFRISPWGFRSILTDETDLLLSIDKNGKIGYEKIIRKSKRNQKWFEDACISGVKYAKPLNPPPAELYKKRAINGKIYIPLRFIFVNPTK